MNSKPSAPADDDPHCYDTALKLSAAKLDVHKHERLAYTETPVKSPAPRPLSKRMSALLKAMYYFVLSR